MRRLIHAWKHYLRKPDGDLNSAAVTGQRVELGLGLSGLGLGGVIVASTSTPIPPVQLGLFSGAFAVGCCFLIVGYWSSRTIRSDYQRGEALGSDPDSEELTLWLIEMDRRYAPLPQHRTAPQIRVSGSSVAIDTTPRYRARMDWLHERMTS